MTQGHVFSFGWIKAVGEYPWKFAFGLQFLELSGSKVKVVISNTCNTRSYVIENGNLGKFWNMISNASLGIMKPKRVIPYGYLW